MKKIRYKDILNSCEYTGGPLFECLVEQLNKCSGSEDCNRCPVKGECVRLWDQEVSKIDGNMKIQTFVKYFNKFKQLEEHKKA